jgi:hypothetical protein
MSYVPPCLHSSLVRTIDNRENLSLLYPVAALGFIVESADRCTFTSVYRFDYSSAARLVASDERRIRIGAPIAFLC